MQREMERFLTHLGRGKRPLYFFEKAWKPLCDVSETQVAVIVVVDLGKIEADALEINVTGNSLVIRGHRKEPANAPRRLYHQMEISYGPFERELELPARVDVESAEATYEGGFLEIKLPKVAREPRMEVEVNVPNE